MIVGTQIGIKIEQRHYARLQHETEVLGPHANMAPQPRKIIIASIGPHDMMALT